MIPNTSWCNWQTPQYFTANLLPLQPPPPSPSLLLSVSLISETVTTHANTLSPATDAQTDRYSTGTQFMRVCTSRVSKIHVRNRNGELKGEAIASIAPTQPSQRQKYVSKQYYWPWSIFQRSQQPLALCLRHIWHFCANILDTHTWKSGDAGSPVSFIILYTANT